MSHRPSRRDLMTAALAASAAAALALAPGAASAQSGRLVFGPARPFSWDELLRRAREAAAKPYAPPPRPAPAVVERIGYDQHGAMRFRPDAALFADAPSVFPIAFFPLGKHFPATVRMHAIDGGEAREIFYSPDYFEMPLDSPGRELPRDAGFAGFQIKEAKSRPDWQSHDWAAFLGASYFRAIGSLGQYGLSARGLAVDVASPTPEEFPNFTEFYFQGAANASTPVTVMALLDGPSATAAFRFSIRRTAGVVMDVEANFFLRRDVSRFGIAPLTSMYWYSETDKRGGLDWRPEVHDSDGLELWTGAGERIWRPLANPPRVAVSAFQDTNPRGFGLMQRDRNNEHYLDGVNYERRPSAWVEPIGAWGEGSVQLVEIPTGDEVHDNIVAMWVPRMPIRAGQAHDFRYRLHWLADDPYPPEALARVAATRVGRGGEPGQQRPAGHRKFVVEFGGRPLPELKPGEVPEAVLSTSRGELGPAVVERVPWTERWRARFDLAVDGPDPVDLRLHLKLGDRVISETWICQHHPQQVG